MGMASIHQQLSCGGWTNNKGTTFDRKRTRFVSTTQRSFVRADSKPAQCGKKRNSNALKLAGTAGPLLLTSILPESSGALTAEDVAGTFNKFQSFTEQVISTAGSTFSTVSGALQQAYSFIKPAVDVTLPVVQKTTDLAIKTVAPLASDVASQAVKTLQNAGVDTKPVLEAGQTAVSVAGNAAAQTTNLLQGAKPVVTSTLESLITSDPFILAGEAGALLLLYLLAPGLLSAIGTSARGYKGDLTAPQALDNVSNRSFVLVDVRSEKEKSRAGLPSLPNKAKRNFIGIPIEEFPAKIRSQLRNPRAVEAEVAALKIANLKRVNKGTNIVILDSSGNSSKAVAKSLTALGFKNSWILVDGFEGGRGWLQNRLGKESYNSSFAEILSPSRIIPAASNKLFKTVSSSSNSRVVDVAPRGSKLLPSGE